MLKVTRAPEKILHLKPPYHRSFFRFSAIMIPFLQFVRTRLAFSLLVLLCLTPASMAQAQGDIEDHLQAFDQLSLHALEASRTAEQASSVADVKAQADVVFEAIWGLKSGLADGQAGAAAIHGWKTRWQVTNADFDDGFAERYGTKPPEITDPTALGMLGRGRYVRKQLQALVDGGTATEAQQLHAPHVIASLNNVIGWMKMDDGVTKAERQPRVDLTRVWDAPSAFWLSTSDTGWLHEAYAQALNILKTDYEDDVATARQHAAAMTQLLEKCRDGVDADQDGAIAPAMMEGGLSTALQHAQMGGY